MTHQDRHTDVLDFPDATALKAAGRVEAPDPAVLATARALVRRAVAADTATGAPTMPESTTVATHRFGRRRILACAAAVAAVAAGAAVLPVVGMGGEPAAGASAAELFNSIADRAASGQGSDAPYWKTTVRSAVEGDKVHTDTSFLSRTKLVIKTQNGRVVTKQAPPGGVTWSVGTRQVGWDGLDRLPTRPDALRRVLSAGAEGSAAAERTVRQAAGLLSGAPTSPQLRAALYRVLADTPGAEVTEGVKDAVGRTGTKVSWKWSDGFEHSPQDPNWIVRPSDGKILEINHTPQGDPGRVTGRDTILFDGPADSVG
ncbi:hypothetical protein AB0F07_31630 [Streptomyces fructofermentans]|uniref:hypothetical protein n=1 Tax=Streptomyces fructofermentans TaxID=152141 RepID=UPI0033C076AD